MISVEGKVGIKATVICDSISEAGVRLTTFECEYPRIIHAELLTHSMLVRNSASSRAIPAAKMAEQLTARPVRFGKNVSGMQDAGEHTELLRANSGESFTAEEAWNESREAAALWAGRFAEAGYHKQVFNRLTETFQMMKTVITATEWNNFFWLRNHGAADPTFEELARCMHEAREKSVPQLLQAGEWHLPYVDFIRGNNGQIMHGDWIEHPIEPEPAKAFREHTLDDAIKVSAARCAAVSYRNIDYGVEKCREVHARLVGDERKHASAMAHQATPIAESQECLPCGPVVNLPRFPSTWEPGISHADRDGQLWSAQFRGWIMYRKLIPGENIPG